MMIILFCTSIDIQLCTRGELLYYFEILDGLVCRCYIITYKVLKNHSCENPIIFSFYFFSVSLVLANLGRFQKGIISTHVSFFELHQKLLNFKEFPVFPRNSI